MKVLLISNSFGANLQTYAHQIALSSGYQLDIYTLYIGGCSLKTHYENIVNDAQKYDLYINGEYTKKVVSISEAIKMESWDYISLQQASHLSGFLPSYYPYFQYVHDYVKSVCPATKIMLHKTWPYSSLFPQKYIDTKNRIPEFNFQNADEMEEGINNCVKTISKDFTIDLLIDSGDIVYQGSKSINYLYDEWGFHMSNEGCYLIGLNLIYHLFNCINFDFKPDNISKEHISKINEFFQSYSHLQ